MIKQLSKRASAVICVAFMLVIAVVPAFAQSKYSDKFAVTDDAGIFSEEQFNTLCTNAESAGTMTGIQIAIHTCADGVNADNMKSHYDMYYQANSAIYKSDCALLVFDAKSGYRTILTYGSAKKVITDGRIKDIQKAMKPFLDKGDDYNAACEFINQVEKIYSEPKIITSLKKYGWIGGIAGVVIAIIFVLVNVGRYKYNGKGGTYELDKNSQMDLLDSQDVFVSKHTTYTTIQSSNNSSGGGSSPGGGDAF